MDGEPDHHMQGVEGVLKPHFCQYGDSMTSFFECEIKTNIRMGNSSAPCAWRHGL